LLALIGAWNRAEKMHELSIAQNIIEIICDQMRIHNLSRIESVSLRIGLMRCVVMESLRFSFDVLASGSPLEGARLEVEEVPIRGRCLECGHGFTLKTWMDDCPLCRGARVEIISGKELDIVSIEGD
jgi:hydrogenase nickel incorporation protein HypA/HybF